MARRQIYVRLHPDPTLLVGDPGTIIFSITLCREEIKGIVASLYTLFGRCASDHILFLNPSKAKDTSEERWKTLEESFNISFDKGRYRFVTSAGYFDFAGPSFLNQIDTVCRWFSLPNFPYHVCDNQKNIQVESVNGRFRPLISNCGRSEISCIIHPPSRMVDKDHLNPKCSCLPPPLKLPRIFSSGADAVMEKAMGSLSFFPNELIVHIFSFLCDTVTLERIALINRIWADFSYFSVIFVSSEKILNVPQLLRYRHVSHLDGTVNVRNNAELDRVLERNFSSLIITAPFLSDATDIIHWICQQDRNIPTDPSSIHDFKFYHISLVNENFTFSYSTDGAPPGKILGGTLSLSGMDKLIPKYVRELRSLRFGTYHLVDREFPLPQLVADYPDLHTIEYRQMGDILYVCMMAQVAKNVTTIRYLSTFTTEQNSVITPPVSLEVLHVPISLFHVQGLLETLPALREIMVVVRPPYETVNLERQLYHLEYLLEGPYKPRGEVQRPKDMEVMEKYQGTPSLFARKKLKIQLSEVRQALMKYRMKRDEGWTKLEEFRALYPRVTFLVV